MGRIFETRKATMFRRWDKMAKLFTRISKDIAIAVKSGGGTTADTNPMLRRVLANARANNMPREKIESAIKRASGQDQKAYEELLYEGYAPHGIALMVETATDNPQRTVANLRSTFKDYGGNLGQNGSVAFLFQKMGVFRLKPQGLDLEALELDLIDHGLEEMGEGLSNDEREAEKGIKHTIIRCAFADFGRLQSAIEARKLDVAGAESEWVPQTLVTLPEAQATEVLELVDALEQDEDVQKVFHNLG